jgi:Ca-activated chloride channel family protein
MNRLIPSALIATTLTVLLAACGARLTQPDPETPPLTPVTVIPAEEAQQRVAAVQRRQAESQAVTRHVAEPMLAMSMGAASHDLAAPAYARVMQQEVDNETYGHFEDNPVFRAAEDPVSTFSVDVDTGAYANLRRMLNEGRLPPADAVRTEELLNYFRYDYPAPTGDAPFAFHTEVAPAPWAADRLLLHIGLRGKSVSAAARQPANLVFLIDVSGSMADPNKLPLLKQAFGLLARQLDARDSVSMVVYAGSEGLVLKPTPGDRTGEILAALSQLDAGGSTNGGAGIDLAYAMARQAFRKDGVNRVILATDGDFNVGTVSFEALKDRIARERSSGITLTTLGFGSGNYNDRLMEQLADVGNGNYAYIDSLQEARKVLVDEVAGTLQIIAGDVKAQVEFNPAVVAEYRLIGYENRVLRREDFNNDKVDAGDIGAGHTVTALYEIALVGSKGQQVDPLRYGTGSVPAKRGAELAHLRLRYKQPGESESRLLEQPILRSAVKDSVAAASVDFRFAAAVAGFGQLLRGGEQVAGLDYAAIERLARDARGADAQGTRAEFVNLVALARSLAPRTVAQTD